MSIRSSLRLPRFISPGAVFPHNVTAHVCESERNAEIDIPSNESSSWRFNFHTECQLTQLMDADHHLRKGRRGGWT